MNHSLDDTIAALASAAGPGLRGLIRISGSESAVVLSQLLNTESWMQSVVGTRSPQRLPVRIPVAGGRLYLPAHVMYWPTRRSFTGETLAELHLIGSPPLLNEVLGKILVSGARPAERGEFTLRAFLAGRIDLVQAEAVLGVIDAGNSTELQTALSQLAGGISGQITAFREELLLHLADLEAGLDFIEEDIEFVVREELTRRLTAARTLVAVLLQQTAGRMLSQGRRKVVLAGLPNAGKSTLFNRLVGRPAALVSAMAGTTRDYLLATLSHAGTTFDIVDTAGWEVARDGIEMAAGELRTDQLQRADLVVWCTAADLSDAEQKLNIAVRTRCQLSTSSLLEIQTKGDRLKALSVPGTSERSELSGQCERPLVVSGERGSGLDQLLTAIAQRLSAAGTDSEMIGATAARCEESLRHALSGIERALESIAFQAGDELIALELREVLEHLGRIVGRVYTDDILDRIFSRFCIGK